MTWDCGQENCGRAYGKEVSIMEKVYKAMKSVGAFNIVFGILTMVGGTLMGAFLIVNGGKLLHRKKDIIF